MFSDAEQKIVDRLRAVLPAGVYVGTLRELEKVPEMRQKAPACWVIYDGFSVGELIPPGTVQKISMQWYVVVAAKSAKGNGQATTARDEASAICDTVLGALLGYHLGNGRYLRLSDAPGPEYDGGYCHVPLAFSNPATFKGQP